MPDTLLKMLTRSPWHCGIERLKADDGFNLGEGAGFYLDAIEMPWSLHYQIYSYITIE